MSSLPSIAKHRFNLNADEILIESGNHDGIDFKFDTQGAVFHVPSGDILTDRALKADTVKDTSDNDVYTIESDGKMKIHKNVSFVSSNTVDFENCTVLNLANSLSGAFTTANIGSVNGYASADLELDNITTTLNTTKNRTENLTTNKIMVSNNAGLLVAGNHGQNDILRNNNTAQQEIQGDLNFSSGKGIKYNGTAISSSNLSDGGDLTKDNVVNTATTTALNLKLDNNLSNIGSSVVPEANIHASITRDAEACLLAGTQTITGNKSFDENINVGAFSSGAYSYITKNGIMSLVNGSGSVSMQFNYPTTSLEISDNSNNDLQIFGGGLTIPTGKTYQINGTQISTSNLSDGGDITKDNVVNTATTTALNLKLDKNLSNIGSSVVPEANIHASITRDADACLLAGTQTITGDKTFSGETSFTDDVYISNTKTIISSGGGTETEYVSSRVGQPSLNSLNTMFTSAPSNTQKTIAYVEYTGETIFQGSIGTNPTADTNSCVMDKTGFLSLNSGGDSKIHFDDSTTDDSSTTGFKIKNNSGTCEITTNLNLTTGHNFKINGTQISTSNLSDGGDITKDNVVNSATTTALNLKLDKNLSNIGSSVIPDSNIPASITRDAEACLLTTNQTVAGVKTFSDGIIMSTTKDITRTENSTATNYLDKVKELFTSYEKTITLPASAFVASTAYKLFDSNDEFDVYEFGVRKGTETINLDDTVFLTSAFKMLLSFQGYTAGAAAGSAYLFDYNSGGGGIHSSLKMMGEIIGHNLYGANDGNAPNTAIIPSVISYHISGMENPTLQYEAPSGAPHTFNIIWGSTAISGTVSGLTNVKIKLIKIADF